jgi:2-C-methyl-D-erythritol 2,4-cyclodiphosphate synthase
MNNFQYGFNEDQGGKMRIGIGYDVHRLVEGRKLTLGGITIPFKKGLLGHSDADVLIHAVCDALLGAAGLGDIGLHFPDTDPKLKDISSMIILSKTYNLLKEKGFTVINLDSTIMAEEPKIAPFRATIQKNIARAIEIEPKCVNVKATTLETLGMLGRGEGIAALCIALIE